jgi:serine/threonine protein kinase
MLLSDFGVAFKPAEERRTTYPIPFMLSPPEKHFLPDQPVSFPSDIWSLGCAIGSIVAQGDLFSGWENYLIADHTAALGMPPPEWWERWQGRSEFFDETGSRIFDADEPPESLTDRLEEWIQKPRERAGMEIMGSEEKEAFSAF